MGNGSRVCTGGIKNNWMEVETAVLCNNNCEQTGLRWASTEALPDKSAQTNFLQTLQRESWHAVVTNKPVDLGSALFMLLLVSRSGSGWDGSWREISRIQRGSGRSIDFQDSEGVETLDRFLSPSKLNRPWLLE